MKKVSLFLAILAISISVFATVAVWQHITHERKAPDTDTIISQITEKVTNPEFTTPEDVLSYQMGLAQKAQADKIFSDMTEKDVYNAFSVCKNTLGKVTKMDLVHEYLKHKSVYDNLPNDAQKDSITTAPPTNQTPKEISPGDSAVKSGSSNVRVIIEQK